MFTFRENRGAESAGEAGGKVAIWTGKLLSGPVESYPLEGYTEVPHRVTDDTLRAYTRFVQFLMAVSMHDHQGNHFYSVTRRGTAVYSLERAGFEG